MTSAMYVAAAAAWLVLWVPSALLVGASISRADQNDRCAKGLTATTSPRTHAGQSTHNRPTTP